METTMKNTSRYLAAALLLVLAACAPTPETDSTLEIAYEKYELENGLDVVLHVDRSDPIAAVAMTFHVGSAREVEGRTGFAHLFEHLFFLDSENLGPGGLDQLMARVGSSTNGSTSNDRTNYFEVVPNDALEKALWAESDKLGFFINTVSESVVAKEKQVVKNEKRQSVDNRPYGHTNYVIDKALYPEEHPYNWQVIGSLADLDAATLADVKEFHRKWYGPNNATLAIAGDIDVEQTKAWIEKYFGSIAAREMPEVEIPEAPALEESIRLSHEDNYARVPELRLTWPTVPNFHPDSYALDVLADLLTNGKQTPFYKVLVEEDELAPSATARAGNNELAGQFTLRVRTYADIDLDDALAGVEKAFARFEQGIPDSELERVKAQYETGFYGGVTSALGKAFQLAHYNIFAPSPGYFSEVLEQTLAVGAEDVMRVYETYIKDQPHIATSFVPLGEGELALENSTTAQVVIEPIVQGAEAAFTVERGTEITPPTGALDRSVEPPFGEAPTLTAPAVARESLANGLEIFLIETHETPLVTFEIALRGGHLLESRDKPGVANLLAQTMTEGTANKTPDELEQAIDLLGSTIEVEAGSQSLVIGGATLARNYDATMALVEEILLEPRWDAERFELARERVRNQLQQRSANPTAIATDVFQKLLYGDHILAQNAAGSAETIDSITLEDLQAYYQSAVVSNLAAFHIAGAVSMEQVQASLAGIGERWQPGEVEFPAAPVPDDQRAGLYFVDVPGAAQSRLMIGRLALAETDPDFYPANVLNYRLGGGGFASDLMQVLREGKGYTYGIGSFFRGTQYPGPFAISSGVRSNVTLESLELIKDIVERHGPEFDEEDLAVTQGFLIKNNAGAFETLNSKLGILSAMSSYGFDADYVLQREAIVREMTIERIRELADAYLDPQQMIWLIVGDAATQQPRLSALGLGEPIALDRNGQTTQ
jgi:zinc protease